MTTYDDTRIPILSKVSHISPGVSPGPCLSLIGRSSGRSVTKLLAPPISDTSE